MKYLSLFLVIISFGIVSCQSEAKQEEDKSLDLTSYEQYGEEFEVTNVLTNADVRAEFSNLENGDSIQVQFKAPMNDVCKMKGCWMVVDLGNNETARVSFKDYGFFVPTESEAGTEVIMNGWAHVKETSVDDLRHLAEDAGKSKEEIEAIVEPEVGYSFVADGVFIKKSES